MIHKTPLSAPLNVAPYPAISGSLGVLAAAMLISACGGESGDPLITPSRSEVSVGIEESLPPEVSSLQVQPQFHMAPAVLPAPDNIDAIDPEASSRQAAYRQVVAQAMGGISTQRLTLDRLGNAGRMRAAGVQASTINGNVSPMAAGTPVSVYTPAQIRAAYGMPSLPALGQTPTPAQAAQMGAGQTIYIVNAMHNPNVVAELNAFNQKFGLPNCSVQAISPTTPLPLPSASPTAGCLFSVVYSTPTGGMTSTAPAYDSGWATEIALDVQWAHATAPMARIILIEAPDASLGSMSSAIRLANAMGPGIVSMSFGAGEGSWSGLLESSFSGTNMSYFGATGDWGSQVMWPSVSPRVVAVGGTSLSYTGTGPRKEVGWSSTGGGVSLYTAAPSYQNSSVPGMTPSDRRALADVGFNADPATGQYVALMPPGNSAISWVSVGGTSLSTPQWAGLAAIANAQRAQASKVALGLPHGLLYSQIASIPGTYASAFSDIQSGSNGSCSICAAKIGYDGLTGLGTPNVSALLSALSGANVAPAPAPVVNGANVNATAGTALSFKVSVAAPNPVSLSLTGAPSGMSISSEGLLSWPAPVVGTYTVTVTAKDNITGLSGQGTLNIIVKAPALPAPTVSSGSINSTAGKALSFTATVKATNPVTWGLSNAPSGMVINSTGVVTWPNPVAGSYSLKVTAQDKVTGLTGQGVYTLNITKAPTPPTITTATIMGKAGVALSGSFKVSDPNGLAMSVKISGVPAGMTFAVSGQTISLNWPKPLAGTFNLGISVTNSAGASAQATLPIKISPP